MLDQNGVARAREEFLLVSARVAFAPVDLVVELIAIILRLQLRRVVNVDLDGWAWVQRLVVGVVELGDVAARAAAGMKRDVWRGDVLAIARARARRANSRMAERVLRRAALLRRE